MTKRTTTHGEKITIAMLDSFLQDLKNEPLYGAVEALDHDDTDVASTTVLGVLNGTSDDVAINLPAATGSGRILAFVASNSDNVVTVVTSGEDVIGAAHDTVTFAVWENYVLVDAASGQWVVLAGTATGSTAE